MKEYEYEDDWDEEVEEDEEEGWGLSAEEIEKRLQQVNQEKDRKEARKNPPKADQKEAIPKPTKSKRSKRQGLKLLLIRDYLYNEASKEFPKNSTHIIKFLKENYDIEATDRTIHTDIKRLIKDAGVPIKYNAKRHGYYITERPFSTAELRLLVDCVRNTEFLTKRDAGILVKKVMGLASSPDKEMLTYPLEEEDRKSQTEASVIENLPLLIKAIESKKKISFNRYYYTAEHTIHTFLGSAEYIVSPHKLIRKDNQYILEYAEDYADMPKFEDMDEFEDADSFEDTDEFEDMDETEYEGQIHQKIDVSMLANIKILDMPSTYKEVGSIPGQQTMDEILDWLLGKKRAITIRFRNEVLDKVVNKLSEDAVLIDVDERHFKTTIVDRASSEVFSWIASFGCNAKILGPNDIIEVFMCRQKMRLYDYDLLYKRDYEPISILTDEELSLLSGEKYSLLMYDERELFPPEYTVEGEKS